MKKINKPLNKIFIGVFLVLAISLVICESYGIINLISPSDGDSTNNLHNFSCSATAEGNKSIIQGAIQINDSEDNIVYENEITDITNNTYMEFEWNNVELEDGNYTWGCSANYGEFIATPLYIEDITHNSGNGEISGATLNETGGPEGEGAFVFDGVDDYINMGDVKQVEGIDELTISLWANQKDLTDGSFISKGNYYNSASSWALPYFESSKRVAFGIDNTRYFYTNDAITTANEWNYITITYSNLTKTSKIYINGVDTTLTNNVGDYKTINFTTKDLLLGKDGGGRYLNGSISKVKIFDRALNQTEITALYDSDTILNSEGLVANYPMDAVYKNYVTETTTTLDASGNGNNGTLSGGMELTSEYAKNGYRGAGFDGVDDYIEGGDIADNIPEISISGWFKIENLSTVMGLVSKGKYYNVDSSFNLGIINADLNRLAFSVGNSRYFYANNFIEDNNWHHVAVTYSNVDDSNYMYLDGEDIPLEIQSGTFIDIPNTALTYKVGKDPGNNYLNGSIDDVRIFNRSLSESEIQELYTTNSITDETGLVAYYDMEDLDTNSSSTRSLNILDHPKISVLFPLNNTGYRDKLNTFSFENTIENGELDYCYFNLSDEFGTTQIENTEINLSNQITEEYYLGEGDYTLKVYCNSSLNTESTELIEFSIVTGETTGGSISTPSDTPSYITTPTIISELSYIKIEDKDFYMGEENNILIYTLNSNNKSISVDELYINISNVATGETSINNLGAGKNRFDVFLPTTDKENLEIIVTAIKDDTELVETFEITIKKPNEIQRIYNNLENYAFDSVDWIDENPELFTLICLGAIVIIFLISLFSSMKKK